MPRGPSEDQGIQTWNRQQGTQQGKAPKICKIWFFWFTRIFKRRPRPAQQMQGIQSPTECYPCKVGTFLASSKTRGPTGSQVDARPLARVQHTVKNGAEHFAHATMSRMVDQWPLPPLAPCECNPVAGLLTPPHCRFTTKSSDTTMRSKSCTFSLSRYHCQSPLLRPKYT